MSTNKDLDIAKNKLAHAKENGTTAVLTTEEASALYDIVESMSIVNFGNTPNSNTVTPKLKRCLACNGSGYYDHSDANGNNIPCGECKGEGFEPQ